MANKTAEAVMTPLGKASQGQRGAKRARGVRWATCMPWQAAAAALGAGWGGNAGAAGRPPSPARWLASPHPFVPCPAPITQTSAAPSLPLSLLLISPQVLMLSSEAVINKPLLERVIAAGHSRVPVYEGDNKQVCVAAVWLID